MTSTIPAATDNTTDHDDWRTAYLAASCVTEVSPECAAGACANCWDDECGCPFCGHPGEAAQPPSLAELVVAGRETRGGVR